MRSQGRNPHYTFEIGHRIGCLVIADRLVRDGGKPSGQWIAKCDCGRSRTLFGSQLVNREYRWWRCGAECGLEGKPRRGRTAPWTAKQILDGIRANTKRPRGRLHEITLTVEDIERVRVGQPCAYCNGPISPRSVGLDRLDNSRGYEPGNVVPCCGFCNDARGHLLSPEEFAAAMAVRLRDLPPGVGAWDGWEWRAGQGAPRRIML